MSSNDAWSVWWHPRRTSRELNVLYDERAVMVGEIARLERELEEYNRLKNIEQRCKDLELHLAEYENDKRQWREVGKELQNVLARVEEMQIIKERYEKTIETLRHRLREERSQPRGYDAPPPEISELIDPEEEAAGLVRRSINNRRRLESKPDTDWLLSLPDDL